MNIAVLLWLAVCAWTDWKHRKVTNWLVIGPLPVALVIRLTGHAHGPWLLVLLIWLIILAGWVFHLVGGADVKGALVLALLDPRLVLFAWSGICAWYLMLKLFTRNRQGPYDLPGFAGFLIGAALYSLFFQL